MRVQEDSAAPKVPSVPAVLSDLLALRGLKVPKDRRGPSVLRGFPERQVQPERRDLRVYKERPERREPPARPVRQAQQAPQARARLAQKVLPVPQVPQEQRVRQVPREQGLRVPRAPRVRQAL